MRDANRRYHDRIAGRYDEIYAKDPYWAYVFEVSWQDLRDSLPRDLARPVLDVGCGTGLYGLALLKAGFRVVFSDLSPAMLDRAGAKAAAEYEAERFELVRADIGDLEPFSDESFDLVVGQGDPLGFAEDWRAALRAVRRVLRPGGRAVLSVDSRFGGMDPFVTRDDFEGLIAWLDSGDGRWLAHQEEERFPLHAFTPEELECESLSAGLSVVRLIGKTVLDLRGGHAWLLNRERRRAALELERRFQRSELALGRAHHLQLTVERPADGEAPESALSTRKVRKSRPKARRPAGAPKRGRKRR